LKDVGLTEATYIAIDDDSMDMDAIGDCLVKTTGYEGLMDEQVVEAIEKLGVS